MSEIVEQRVVPRDNPDSFLDWLDAYEVDYDLVLKNGITIKYLTLNGQKDCAYPYDTIQRDSNNEFSIVLASKSN